MTVERLRPEGLYRARGFAHATLAKGTSIIHVGGQIAADMDGNILCPDDYRAQGELALRNLVTALDSANATPADIANVTVYIVALTPTNQSEVFDGYGSAATDLGVRGTAFAVIGVQALGHPQALVELTAVAVI